MDTKEMNATPEPVNVQAAENPVPVTPSPEPRKKSSGKFVFFMVGLAIGVCATAVLIMSLAQIRGGFGKNAGLEGKGYDTPEDAVKAYAEYFMAGDFDGMVSTFAMESRGENFDLEEYYDRIRIFSPALATGGQQNAMLGSDSDLVASVNLENRRAYISSNVYRQLLVLVSAEIDDEELAASLESGTTFTISDDDELETLMDFLNSSPEYEDMKIGKNLKASDFNSNFKTGLKEFIKGKEKAWGGEFENVSLKVEIDGEDYILFMTCVCYDDRWYVAEFGNYYSLAGNVTPQAGGLCTEDSYRGLE